MSGFINNIVPLVWFVLSLVCITVILVDSDTINLKLLGNMWAWVSLGMAVRFLFK